MLEDFEHCSLPLSTFICIKEILQNHKQSGTKQIHNLFLEKIKAGIIHRPQNAKGCSKPLQSRKGSTVSAVWPRAQNLETWHLTSD